IGLLNTLSGLVLVYSGLLLPFVIWILEGYYRDFPTEIEEAAAMDGCSPLRTFVSIVLPLSRNGLFAAAAFVFISVWSDFIVGLTLTSSEKAWPISVALAQALNPITEPNWGLLNAAGLVAALVPAILAFIFRGAVMCGLLSGGYARLTLNIRDHDLDQPKDFERSHHDLRAGIDYLIERFGRTPAIVGHGYANNKIISYSAQSGDERIDCNVLATLGSVKKY